MRHGFLLIRKPRGPTSHDIVAMLRKSLGEGKIGHLGTLDPMAEGLLVIAVGAKGLKVVELFSKLTKEYVAEITLGAVSDTFDAEGRISEVPIKAGWLPPDDSSRIQAVIDDRFIGKIAQVPPQFSAIKVGGTRAYRKAQRGEQVEMKAREANINECKVLDYSYPRLRLRVACGSGTYIRSLANDLGESLRCGGYLSALIRTKVGEWKLDDAVAVEGARWADVIPLKDLLKSFPGRPLLPIEWGELQHGRPIPGTLESDEPFIAWSSELPVALLEKDKKHEGMLKPRKVL